jgi:hypothetical protein
VADGFVGQAFVQIQPSFVGFQRQISREMSRSLSGVGRDAGRQLGTDISRATGGGRDLIPRRGMEGEADSAGRSIAGKIGGALGKVSTAGLEKVGTALLGMGKAATVGAGLATTAIVGFAAANAQTYTKAMQFNNALSLVGDQMGVSNTTITDGIRRMVGLGSSTQNARSVMMQFVRTGGDATRAWELYARAEDIAVTTGQTGNEVIQELIYGLQTGNTNLAIFRTIGLNATDAQDKFAQQIGKTRDQLTDAEKQQALFNGIMEKTGNIAGIAGKMMAEGPFNWAAMQAPIANLREAMGSWLEPAFTLVGRAAFGLTREFSAAISEGGKFYPVVQVIQDIFKGLAEPIATVIQRIRDFVANVGSEQIQGFTNTLKELAPIIPAVAAALATFAGGIATRNIPVLGQLVGSLNPVAAGLLGLAFGMPEVRDAFGQLLGAVMPLVRPLLDLGRRVLGTLVTVILQLVRAALPVFVRLIGALLPVVGRLMPVITRVVDILGDALVGAIGSLGPMLVRIVELFGRILDAIAPLLPPIATLVGRIIEFAVRAIEPLIDPAIKLVEAALYPMLDIVELLIGPLGVMIELLGPLLVVMGEVVGTILTALAPILQPLAYGATAVAIAFGIWNAVMWAMSINPIVLIILGIVAAIALVVIAVRKLAEYWTTIWGWIVDNWKLLAVILLAPIALPLAIAAGLFFLFRDKVMAVFNAVWGAILWAWNLISPIVNAIAAAFTWLLDTVIRPVINWIIDNWRLLAVIFAGVILGPIALVVAAFVFFRDTTVAVFSAVGNAFMWVWRALLLPVFTALWTIVSWVWNAVLRPVFSAIITVWTAVANAIKWAWAAIILPTINVLWAIFRVVIALWLLPLFLTFRAAWWALSTGFKWAWDNVIKPAVNALWSLIKWAWETVIQPLFRAFMWVWNQVATTFKFYWENIIKPAWNALTTALQWAWNTIIHPIFALIQRVWGAVGNTIRSVWERFISPAWEAMKNGIRSVRDVVSRMVDAIRSIWDGIRSALRKPVKWVVDFAINPLIKGANLILDKIGLGIKPIPGFAAGGRIPGWGGGDRVLSLLEPGEWVLTKQQARAIGYHRLRGLPRYARGGMVDDGPGARWSWNPIDIGRSVVGGLVDLGGNAINAATNLIRWAAYQAFEKFTAPFRAFIEKHIVPRLGTGDWFGGAFGKYTLYLLDKLLEFVRGKSEDEITFGGGMGIDDIVRQVIAQFPALRVTSALRPGDTKSYHSKNLARDLAGPQDVMYNAGKWVQDTLAAALLEGIHNPTLSVKDGKIVGPGLWGPATWAGHRDHLHLAAEAAVGATVGGDWGSWMATAMRVMGVNPAVWSAALTAQARSESNFDPRAINNYDSNAQKGTPSKGLMQVIDPTFQAMRARFPQLAATPNNIWDPVANIAAGIAWMMYNYGANPHSLGRMAGRIGRGYDSGGWLPPGASIAVNNTGRPEPVLSARQWDDLLRSSEAGGDMRPVVELLRRIATATEHGTSVVIDGREVARVVDREIGWVT